MKRVFNHLVQILVLGSIFFLMVKMPLFKIPHIQGILTGIILVGLLFFVGILGRLYWIKKKNLLKIIIVSFLFFSHVGFAQSITGYTDYSATTALMKAGQNIRCSSMNYCIAAETYDEATFKASQNNWEGDRPCKSVEVNCVREKLNQLKISPSVFVAEDKLTSKERQTYRSFRKDSHWKEWVKENYSESASGTDTAEDLACAAKFASLCSEYDRRHPSSKARTVAQIMEKDAKDSGCWPCKMAYIILTVVQDLSSNLESKMQEAALRILQMLFLLWILYTAFLAVIFPSKGNNFLKDLMKRLFCVIIVSIILASGNNLQEFYRSTLSPIISMGLGVTQDINEAIKVDISFAKDLQQKIKINSTGKDYCSNSKNIFQQLSYQNSASYKKTKVSKNSLITQELEGDLLCMTQNMYRQFSPITAIGQSLIGFSLTENKSKIASAITNLFFDFSIPNLEMWSVGFILVVLFSILSFLIAFKIIDIFLRLGFVLVLMPLFVATWAFPLTRDFTKKGFMFLLNIITEFLGLVLAVNFIVVFFEAGIVNNKTELIAKMAAPYSKKYGENLLNVILSNGGWYFFFMLIALAFMGFKLISICSNVVGGIFGTKAVGGDITGPVAASSAKMIGQLGKKGWDVGSKVAENAESHHTPSDKSASFVAGRAIGRIKSGQNPFKDIPNPFRGDEATSSPAASKRFFSQKAGDGVNKISRGLANGLDRIGVTAGQALQKTGIGAIVGVPLTLGTKTLTTGIRAGGKIISGTIKTAGAGWRGIRHPVQTTKNAWNATKEGAKNAWNKVTSGPKKLWGDFKQGFTKGDKK